MKKRFVIEQKDKKSLTTEASIYILFGYIMLYPALLIICIFFGYKFDVTYPTVYSVGGVVISVTTVVLGFVFKECTKSDIALCLCSLSPLFALISTVIFVFNYCTLTAMVCSLLVSVCCCILAVKSTKSKKDKILAVVVFILLFVFTFFLSGMCLVFGSWGSNTIVKTVDSPDGTHYAEVIDADQGALGGDTIVYVFESNKEFNLLIFRISKKPQRVYISEWGESKDMDIYFKSDDCIVINSVEYEIK